MSQFFGIFDDALPADFCRRTIERFEADERKITGRVGDGSAGGAIDPNIKSTTEILLNSDFPEWQDVLDTVGENLKQHLREYMMKWRQAFPCPIVAEEFRVSRYNPGEQFTWHSDNIGRSVTRVITAQWYLNDVDEGGETEFPWYNAKVKPREGRLMLAPVGWTFMHRGAPPVSGPKYIVITQLHQVQDEPLAATSDPRQPFREFETG